MAEILCRTRENTNPKGKPRVYFTCHPADFEKYFHKICQDIFKTHDVAVFYTEDMAEQIPEQNREVDLGSNNLFVVPVTFRLLSQPCRAMEDVAYAMEKHIPVLPFMMEPGIRDFYVEKFGQRQYLSPFSSDSTEISYEQKLKKFLESVLISENMAAYIRAHFDGYIFLSYRKKDRRYANELMKLIHSYPEFRSIAIWYDEFLTPGESFVDNIKSALDKSRLVALLVTPNLLEEQNYVMREEYPAARKAGKMILPVEMEQTDFARLSAKFEGVPSCLDPHQQLFKQRLTEAVSTLFDEETEHTLLHDYCMGLAYLEGIDVEVDRRRGVELLTQAAEAGSVDAMEKLHSMYSNGIGVRVDYREARKWAERLAAFFRERYGADHPDTLRALNSVAIACSSLGEYQKALELTEQVYDAGCKTQGSKHINSVITLHNLAVCHSELGDHQKALELFEKAYILRCSLHGREDPLTLKSLGMLALEHYYLRNYKMAVELGEKVYALQRRIIGEEHLDVVNTINNLAITYSAAGNGKKALALNERACALRRKLQGTEHPDTARAMVNLALSYGKRGDRKRALKLYEEAYAICCRILGEEHPDTLLTEKKLRSAYRAGKRCQHCGGRFQGLLSKKCSKCGKPKDY